MMTSRLQTNQLNREYEGGVAWDDTSKSTRTYRFNKKTQNSMEREKEEMILHTVCHVWWDGQGTLLIEAHTDESIVPTLDDLANPDCKGESE